MCASLGALHWDRRREAALTAHRTGATFRIDGCILPSDRWEICDALVQMLLQRRERESLGSSDEEAVAAVRCLRLIGSRAADAAIDDYRDFTAPAVLEELAQVRHLLTLPAVLAEVQGNRSPDYDYRWLEGLPAAVKARGWMHHICTMRARAPRTPLLRHGAPADSP